MSTDLELSKAQISKIIQSGWFLVPLLSKFAGPLMKLMKVAIPFARNVLAPLAAVASATDAGIQKKKKKKSCMVLEQQLY